MRKIIQSGTIITAADTFTADILIEDEKITQIGSHFDTTGAEIVNADGKFVLPGGVDPHTHFDLPMFETVSSDDHYTGHKAAAFGGTTTVIDFVSLDKASLEASVVAWREKADPKACIDFSFHMNITRLDEAIAAEIPQLPRWGITSLKVFSAYNGRLRLQDGEIFQVMRIASENGLLTMLHAENGDVIELLVAEALAEGHTEPVWHARTRPAWGAIEASLRGSALAAQAHAPLYIVHMNTGGEADQLEYARQEGLPIMGETCPQYLFFSEENLQREDGAKWICSPPMRTAADNERLWKALADGTIQTIGTDHCPFFFDGSRPIIYEGQEIAIPGKELGKDDFSKIPNGLPAVGDRLPILWTYGVRAGRISPNQFVELNCTNPAKIFGLYPQKGALVPGADADIVIWDPEKRVTYGADIAQHRTDYNLFEGWELVGYPQKVFSRGRLIVDEGIWLGRAGQGRFIRREPGAQIL
jgi:dihydropyrimidinase